MPVLHRETGFVREQLLERLLFGESQTSRELALQRAAQTEPAVLQIFQRKTALPANARPPRRSTPLFAPFPRMNRFTLRTKRKVNAQWLLYCLVHNIGKCVPRMAALRGTWDGNRAAEGPAPAETGLIRRRLKLAEAQIFTAVILTEIRARKGNTRGIFGVFQLLRYATYGRTVASNSTTASNFFFSAIDNAVSLFFVAILLSA
ncbi:MAG: transposase, partial [Zoogloeaceae bacterium]|nr:transposase [Zoogloeaceae bacterium]